MYFSKSITVALSVVLFFLIGSQQRIWAGNACSKDCNHDCCRSIRITPWDRNDICDPVCKSSCEAAKKICHATGLNVPTLPGPLNSTVDAAEAGCAAAYEVITKGILLAQGSYAAGSDAQWQQARALIIKAGVLPSDAFNGVKIRWCRLLNNVGGVTVDRDSICLNESYLGAHDVLGAAVSLAHEMKHVEQIRRARSTNSFKCEYSKEVARCACQDRRNGFEKEAYDFQAAVFERLERAYQQTTGNNEKHPKPNYGVFPKAVRQVLSGSSLPEAAKESDAPQTLPLSAADDLTEQHLSMVCRTEKRMCASSVGPHSSACTCRGGSGAVEFGSRL